MTTLAPVPGATPAVPPAGTQRGAAILTAMLIVVLVTTLATAALWQQWRSVETEAAERTRTQLAWVLTGALDWARLILREDANSSPIDHLSEPWAVPLAEARLSSFLAVDQNNTDTAMEAFLSGQVTDLQGLLNVRNLVQNGNPSDADIVAFTRLFTLLGLPQADLDNLVERLVALSPAKADGGVAELMPGRYAQLAWLDVPESTLQKLSPFVTLLPGRTTVNLNTAPAQVLAAVLPDLDLAQAQKMADLRAFAHYASVAEGLKAAPVNMEKVNSTLLGVASRWFAVRGQLRIGDTTVQEVSLVEREGKNVKVLWRQRETVAAKPQVDTAAP